MRRGRSPSSIRGLLGLVRVKLTPKAPRNEQELSAADQPARGRSARGPAALPGASARVRAPAPTRARPCPSLGTSYGASRKTLTLYLQDLPPLHTLRGLCGRLNRRS